MKTIAVIPARGGSKGLPGKNIRAFMGVPLLSRAIRACHLANVDLVIVSTDVDDIADVASHEEAVVVRRPAELAKDNSLTVDAVAHAVGKHRCDVVAIVQCTSPMIEPEDVSGTVAALHGGIDLAICVHDFHGIVCDDTGPINFHPHQPTNRQERRPQYVVSGICWACRPEYLASPWMSGNLAYHQAKCPWHIEIDSESDWRLAEAAYALWHGWQYPMEALRRYS